MRLHCGIAAEIERIIEEDEGGCREEDPSGIIAELDLELPEVDECPPWAGKANKITIAPLAKRKRLDAGDAFYADPCCRCGGGIPRSGRKGRPPKVCPSCR